MSHRKRNALNKDLGDPARAPFPYSIGCLFSLHLTQRSALVLERCHVPVLSGSRNGLIPDITALLLILL